MSSKINLHAWAISRYIYWEILTVKLAWTYEWPTVIIKAALNLINIKDFFYWTTVLSCRRNFYFTSYVLWHHYHLGSGGKGKPWIIISSYPHSLWTGNLFYRLFLPNIYHIHRKDFFWFFLHGPFLTSLLNLLQYCFCFMSWFFGHNERGILAPQSGIKPVSPLHWKAKF